MDIKLKKKPWYIRYKYRIAGGAVILAGIVYVIVLASGPRRLRIDIDKIQTSEVSSCVRSPPVADRHRQDTDVGSHGLGFHGVR